MIIYGKRFGIHFCLNSLDAYIFFQFEEYISAALATVKYRAFIERGDNNGVMITGGSGKPPFLPSSSWA